jgi:membrane protein DedA with SNARE-associated domain
MGVRTEARAERRSVLRRRPRLFAGVGVLGLVVLLLLIAGLEGDFPEQVTDVRDLGRFTINHFGAPGALGLLYIEESGVPLPVPGDVYVAYLGRLAGGDVGRWIGAFFGIVIAVVLGSTNLYWASRWFGPRIVEGRVGAALHVEPARLRAAEGWFARWGPVTVIFGRHIPGLRVPITVAAGISRVSYPVFAGSVAISSAGWAAVWLWLGGRYGPAIGRFFAHHAWMVAGFVAVVIILAATTIVRAWRRVPAARP